MCSDCSTATRSCAGWSSADAARGGLLGGRPGLQARPDAGVAALGFLSNVWTLAPRRDKAPEGLKKKNSTQRVVAVALTLLMTFVALTAGIMAAIGV